MMLCELSINPNTIYEIIRECPILEKKSNTKLESRIENSINHKEKGGKKL